MANIIHTSNFAEDSSKYIADLIHKSIDSNGTCVICLAGGTTPIHAYEKLAKIDIE